MIVPVYCPARRKRLAPDECYDRHLEANCRARFLDVQPEIKACWRCEAGARNRARYAEEGLRMGELERGAVLGRKEKC
jgi:hypothetical protein